MTRIKCLGLAVVAVLAISGLLAASASATSPAWWECAKLTKNLEKKYEGKFTDKLCSKEATPTEITEGKTNKYELKEGIGKGKSFKTKAKGEVGFIVKSPQGTFPISCQSVKGSGKPVAPNLETEFTLTLGKCAFFGEPCKSPSGKGIEIKGEGELGFVEEGNAVGLKVRNPAGEGENLATFECGKEEENNKTHEVEPFVKGELFGAVIGVQAGDTSAAAKETTLTYLSGERYGVHVFQATQYHPSVNIVGFSPEGEEAAACFASVPLTLAEEEAQTECQTEHPPHVIGGEYCGRFVDNVLGAKCTPATYTGLTGFTEGFKKVAPIAIAQKGEALMIK